MLVLLGFLGIMTGKQSVSRPVVPLGLGVPLFSLCYLFFLWHLFSLASSEDFKWAFREITKLALGFFAFSAILIFLPRNRLLHHKFWKLAIWSSSMLMAFLIYYYAFVFVKPFLGNNLDEPTRFGKNLLTWYLVFIIPIALSYFIESRKKIVDCIPLAVLVIAWLYAGSRGAWISVTSGIIFLFLSFVLSNYRRGLKVSISMIGGIGLAVFGSFWVLNEYVAVDRIDFVERAESLIRPEATYTSSLRGELAWKALSKFEKSPLLGSGLMNFANAEGFVTHNDYLHILADMGIIGLLLFVGILMVVSTLVYRGQNKIDWLVMGLRASSASVMISLLFINAYNTTIFWMFMGLSIVMLHTRESPVPVDTGVPVQGKLNMN
jgi:O-antigen ligase